MPDMTRYGAYRQDVLYEIERELPIGPGASFQSIATGAAARRSVVTIVANLLEVVILEIKICVAPVGGAPAADDLMGSEIEVAWLNRKILGSSNNPITENETEVAGINFAPGYEDIFGTAKAVTYQSFVGRRGNTNMGFGGIAGLSFTPQTPRGELNRLAAAGRLRVFPGTRLAIAAKTNNVDLRVDAYGHEVLRGRAFSTA